ncbi:hypothetical protein BACERE00185_00856 [Bacillus mobilis]|uniref:Uncharacterized protein n=1 Tax=Bacillus mobilis TaxID=2026190 RepID=A0A1Y5Z4S6_9BACI|nr:hypothetical protein BACERE00185_00856 [Bacillus mobilis]
MGSRQYNANCRFFIRPIVLFKLMFIGYFYSIRLEHQLEKNQNKKLSLIIYGRNIKISLEK